MSSTGDALIGRTLDGRYRVLRRIADGGMATVYLAVDERLDRDVALKVMRQHLVHDESFVTRFRREARSAASLSHPNVVAVLRPGRGRRLHLPRDGVRARPDPARGHAARRGRSRPGPPSTSSSRCCSRSAEAHAKGLIHRDVKPENVIINDNGTVKVADFGLARAVSSQTVTSTQGVLLGTVAYLSPEQVERGIADARSDVYAAGLMLFEMLTGTKAFTGETPIHVAYQHVHGGVPTPSSRVAGLPPALDDLVAVATARDPDDRPADAAEFLDLVRRTRATLSLGALDARPAGVAAVAAASLPTSTTALPVRRGARHRAAARAAGSRPGRAPTPGRSPSPRPRSRAGSSPVATAPPAAALVAGHHGIRAGGRAVGVVLPARPGRHGHRAVGAGPRAGRRGERGAHARRSTPRCPRRSTRRSPKGVVISVDPGPGTNRAPWRPTSSLVVSKGPERYAVPPIVGMTLAEATARIEAVNLTVGKVSKAFDEKVPDGQVVSAKPGPGASLKKSTAVALTVSKGRKPIDVPDLTGTVATKASRQLSDLGLKVDATKQENSDTVAKGKVISQSPRDGTAVPRRHRDARGVQGSGARRGARRRRPAARAGPQHARGGRASRSPCAGRSAGSSARCDCRTPPAAARRPRAAPSR